MGRGSVLDVVDVAEPVVVETVPKTVADAFDCVVLHVPGAQASGVERVFLNISGVVADVRIDLEVAEVVGLADWALCFPILWVLVV